MKWQQVSMLTALRFCQGKTCVENESVNAYTSPRDQTFTYHNLWEGVDFIKFTDGTWVATKSIGHSARYDSSPDFELDCPAWFIYS